MDSFFDDSSGDRLFTVEGYLRGYKQSSKSTFDSDQQFARPIEDEDIFGLTEQNAQIQGRDEAEEEIDQSFCDTGELDFDDEPFKTIGSSLLDERTDSPGHLFEEETIHTNQPPTPQPPSPSQLRLARLKEQIARQAQAIKPKKIGAGFSEGGTIEVVIDQELRSNSDSKFMFNKIFNKSKKALTSPASDKKQKREAHLELLRRKICANKRKVWDTFQRPVDNFDDEEELIESRELEADDEMERASGDGDQSLHSDDSNAENKSPDDIYGDKQEEEEPEEEDDDDEMEDDADEGDELANDSHHESDSPDEKRSVGAFDIENEDSEESW